MYDQNIDTTTTLMIPKHEVIKYNTKQIIEDKIASNFTTTVYRKDSLEKIDSKIFDIFSVDWAFNIAISEFGYLACIDKYMSVYRIHDNGIWSGNNNKQLSLEQSIVEYNIFFQGKYQKFFDKVEPVLEVNEPVLEVNEPKNKKIIKKSHIRVKKNNRIIKGNMREIEKDAFMKQHTNVLKRKRKILINLRKNVGDKMKRKVLIKTQPLISYQKLNIGCGDQYFDNDWLNIDIIEQVRPNYLQLDILKNFPFKNIKLIYNEHFIEHLTKEEGIYFIKNCFDSLDPGGILRIATFNIDNIIDNCHSQNTEWKESCQTEKAGLSHLTKCGFLNATFGNWGHKFVYNPEEIVDSFRQGGFTNIKECDFNISENPELCARETRFYSTLIFEGHK